jgi:hypothetical protein
MADGLGHLDRDPMEEGEDKMRNVLITAAALVAFASSAQAAPKHYPDDLQFAIDQAYLCGGVAAMSEVLKMQGITKPPPEECANAASAGQMQS